MKKRYLTEREAWVRLRDHYNQEYSRSTAWKQQGICWRINELLFDHRLITERQKRGMIKRLCEHAPKGWVLYFYPRDIKGARQRARLITRILRTLTGPANKRPRRRSRVGA